MFLVLRWFLLSLFVPGAGFWRAGKAQHAIAASLAMLPLPGALFVFSFAPRKFVWLVVFAVLVWAVANVVQAALGAMTARKPGARWPSVLGFALAVFAFNAIGRQALGTRLAPFNTPSEGMSPTLIAGDQFYVLADRDRYPLERGSVIVHHDAERGVDFVKRVVGLEGDQVDWDGTTLTINRTPLPTGPCEPDEPPGCHTERVGRRRWRVITGLLALPGSWEVPQGHVFALGDNRDNSLDSRSNGPVALEDVKGVAEVIHFSWPKVSRTGRPLDLPP